jgi:hypothetical protein
VQADWGSVGAYREEVLRGGYRCRTKCWYLQVVAVAHWECLSLEDSCFSEYPWDYHFAADFVEPEQTCQTSESIFVPGMLSLAGIPNRSLRSGPYIVPGTNLVDASKKGFSQA